VRSETRTRTLTLYLLKDSVESFHKALRRTHSLRRVALRSDLPYEGEFWYSVPKPHAPKWVEFINAMLESQISGVNVSSACGVLFIRSAGRTFAFTFGHGRHLLEPDCYEYRFGLKVVLNRVGHERLRSLDMRTYEDVVVSTRRQTSRSAQISAFALDVSRDLLRAVTGEPDDPSFAKRIAGRDSLTISVAISMDRLGEKCQEILEAYRDDRYKEHFDWVDNLTEVRDRETIRCLNERLIQCLRAGSTEKVHLAPPEVVDWQSVDKFRISGTGRNEYDDLDIDEYLATLGEKREQLTIERLKSYHISVKWAETEQFFSRWSLFDCIVWEVKHKGRFYALVEGRWFEIDDKFATRVCSFVNSLRSRNLTLPSAKKREREPDYNNRVASERAELVCLDGFLVQPQDAATRIEFCDLVSTRKHLIYVKRKARSATLSHLFSQGTVAARSFLQDENVREQIRDKLREFGRDFKDVVPEKAKRPNPADYEVVYAVIIKKGVSWPDSLPFFSQLNLMQHARQLLGLAFKVALLRIEEDET